MVFYFFSICRCVKETDFFIIMGEPQEIIHVENDEPDEVLEKKTTKKIFFGAVNYPRYHQKMKKLSQEKLRSEIFVFLESKYQSMCHRRI